MMELLGDQLEAIRDRFIGMCNIDLNNLEGYEVVELLELLPQALMYIHDQYDVKYCYEEKEELEGTGEEEKEVE